MTNAKCKIIVGSAIAIVLMMVLSTVPIYAGDSENAEPREAKEVWRGGEQKSGDKWSWDPVNFILTLKNGLCFKSFSIRDEEGIDVTKPTTIVIRGTVSTPAEEGSIYGIDCNIQGGDVIICGGGTLVSNNFSFICNCIQEGTYSLCLDNVNLKISTSNIGLFANSYDIKITNCKTIEIATEGSFAICSTKKIFVDNSNLMLSNTMSVNLVAGFGGLSFPEIPTGSIVFLDIDQNPTDGLTDKTVYISLTEPGTGFLELNSYTEKEFTPIDVMVFVAILVVAILGIALYFRK